MICLLQQYCFTPTPNWLNWLVTALLNWFTPTPDWLRQNSSATTSPSFRRHSANLTRLPVPHLARSEKSLFFEALDEDEGNESGNKHGLQVVQCQAVDRQFKLTESHRSNSSRCGHSCTTLTPETNPSFAETLELFLVAVPRANLPTSESDTNS